MINNSSIAPPKQAVAVTEVTDNRHACALSDYPLTRFALVLQNAGATVVKTRTAKKRRVANLARLHGWQKATLTVTYYAAGRVIGSNTGQYGSLPELLAALAAFTESDLVSL